MLTRLDQRPRRPRLLVLGAAVLLVAVVFAPIAAKALAADTEPNAAAAGDQMTAAKAAVLGVVEGVTEFLPISSTGHLIVTQRLLGIGDTPETKAAADAYAIAIQFGAILAVVLLYFGRLRSMGEGLLGRDRAGRSVLIALVLAFIPAAIIGVLFDKAIKEILLEVRPVVIAWVVGALFILLVAPRWERKEWGVPLEQITARQALIIGGAQVLALWPGTSRSMVTILAALAVGLNLAAAVEFSFLLGLATLGAATLYEAAKDGSLMIDAYGWFAPLVGLAFAFVSAAIAIRWMVTYLQRHTLAIFGWYRLAVAGLALVLLWAGKI